MRHEARKIIWKGQFAMKKELITGITGQDGSYLAELLLAIGVKNEFLER